MKKAKFSWLKLSYCDFPTETFSATAEMREGNRSMADLLNHLQPSGATQLMSGWTSGQRTNRKLHQPHARLTGIQISYVCPSVRVPQAPR